MNNPILSNFGNNSSGPASFWKRWGWLVLLCIVLIALGGWYAASVFIQPNQAQVLPLATKSGFQPEPVPANAPNPKPNGKVFPYTEAMSLNGENTSISGTVVKVFTSSTNITFIDFCSSGKTCPFAAIIFKNDLSKFPNISQYQGKSVIIAGIVRIYDGQAQIVVSDPSQIWPPQK